MDDKKTYKVWLTEAEIRMLDLHFETNKPLGDDFTAVSLRMRIRIAHDIIKRQNRTTINVPKPRPDRRGVPETPVA